MAHGARPWGIGKNKLILGAALIIAAPVEAASYAIQLQAYQRMVAKVTTDGGEQALRRRSSELVYFPNVSKA
jgi:hypothetical protein